MIKILGFVPDIDPTTPGAILAADNIVPTVRGIAGAPAAQTTGVPALPAACLGASVVKKLDGTQRKFAGTQTKLYELLSNAWTDQSRVGNYTIGTETVWAIEQFGNATLAANRSCVLQRSNGSGAFSDVAGSPQGAHMATPEGFVMLANTIDGTNGDQSDRVWWSAYRDETDWTPDIDTQCSTARLIATEGPINALRTLNDDSVVAYKERGIYVGRYVGAPDIWTFTLAHPEHGADAAGSVVPVESFHIFVGLADFYLFDGATPVSIGEGIREWFFGSELDQVYRYRIKGVHNSANSSVRFYYPKKGSGGVLTRWVEFNYRTRRWGVGTQTVEFPVEWYSGGYTIDGMDALSGQIDGLPDIPLDSPFWNAATPFIGYFDVSHTLQSITGVAGLSWFDTWEMGDDVVHSLLRTLRLRYKTRPSSASMTNYYKDNGSSFTADATTTEASGKFDLLRDAKWHKGRIVLNGDWEATGIVLDLVPGGDD